MTKIFLIFHGRFPSEKAASLFAAKTCEAFADLGVQVSLIVPRRLGRIKKDLYEYYNIKKNFSVVYLPTIDIFKSPVLQFLASYISFFAFSFSCLIFSLFRANKSDIFYTNEHLPLFFLSFFFPNTFFEVHVLPERKLFFYKNFFSRVHKFVSINNWKIKEMQRMFGVEKSKIICEPSAIDITEFDILVSKKDARRKLGLPAEKKIVLYTGHLYSWKGVDTLAEASKHLASDAVVVFVGGTDEDIKEFKIKNSKLKNIVVAGFRPHKEIPLWQKTADVLVLPNTAKEKISKYYTSPMKLFEYMASGKPIVASDLPSLGEILNESNSVLVKPDDPEALAEGIKKVLQNPNLADRIARQSFLDVQNYTWEKRAEKISKFMGL